MCGNFEPQAPRDTPSRLRAPTSRHAAAATADATAHDRKPAATPDAHDAVPKPAH